MKITLKIDGKLAELKDLSDKQKIEFADALVEIAGSNFVFKDDEHRIQLTNCFFSGANPHAFFSTKKKMLPERINNACYATDDFPLLKPIK